MKAKRVVPLTEGQCPQRWPTKAGKPHWRCPDRIAWLLEDDEASALMCERHFATLTEPAA